MNQTHLRTVPHIPSSRPEGQDIVSWVLLYSRPDHLLLHRIYSLSGNTNPSHIELFATSRKTASSFQLGCSLGTAIRPYILSVLGLLRLEHRQGVLPKPPRQLWYNERLFLEVLLDFHWVKITPWTHCWTSRNQKTPSMLFGFWKEPLRLLQH